MSRHDEPKLRLLHGGGSFTAACPAGRALADDRFARRIGWQAVDEPALSDDYEDRLAARIFGADDLDTISKVISRNALSRDAISRDAISRDAISRDVISRDVASLAGRAPRAATDAPVESAPEIRGWLLLAAAAVALLLIGGAAVVTPAGEATLSSPAPRLAPIEWPERTPDVDGTHLPELLDELPVHEPPLVDLTAEPATVPIPPPTPGPGASSPPVRLAVHSTERRLAQVAPAAVERAVPSASVEPTGSAKDLEPEAETSVISPDGEPPRLAAMVPRSTGLAPIALPGPAAGIALADPAGMAEPPTLRDHLSAAGHGDGTMAVLDVIGAGRRAPGRL
jgi:hypothetical protein